LNLDPERKTDSPTGRSARPLGGYLLYTVGEIALVVIGILIALQINNWNDGRKEQLQIKTYLSNLVDALNDDIQYLDYTHYGNTFRSECIKSLLFLGTGQVSKSIPEMKYENEDDYELNGVGMAWDDDWQGPIPEAYDREFTEMCFERTSYGNVIVVNKSTFEEFKNIGLFSYIENDQLKKQINDYYIMMDWHFSDWREANYRGEIDEWEDFLRDEYRIHFSDLTEVKDPIGLIRDNRDLQLEMIELASDAAGRANAAGKAKHTARELIQSIESEIVKMKKMAG